MGFLRKLFSARPQPVITVVSGLPRSGTSMMMKVLDAGGIPPVQDGIRAADEDNPQGYYEFERVKRLDKGDTAWLAEAQGKAVKVISALLKHLPPTYTYRVIFVRRNMAEVLASQRKMLIHRGEDPGQVDDVQMSRLFARHLAEVEAWLAQQHNMRVLYVQYAEALANPQGCAAQINTFCGGSLNERAMALAIDPQLYRNRA